MENTENSEFENEKIIEIRTDLKDQLKELNKFGKFYDDLVEDYIQMVKTKDELKQDIKGKGLRYKVKTGNGFMQVKPNESIEKFIKVNNQMLKILETLGLKAPPESDPGDDDGLC
jgi:phage terminase small subunit